MKRAERIWGVVRAAMLLSVVVLLTGCPDDHEVIPWLEVDNSKITISSRGGDTVVSMVGDDQYKWWRLLSIHSQNAKRSGNLVSYYDEETILVFDPSLSDQEIEELRYKGLPYERVTDSMRMEGKWYRAYVPENDMRSLVVECDSNPRDTMSRSMKIFMTTYDGTIGTIYLWQKSRSEEEAERSKKNRIK